MTNVLVGGRRREEVLDQERKRLEGLAREQNNDMGRSAGASTDKYLFYNDRWYETGKRSSRLSYSDGIKNLWLRSSDRYLLPSESMGLIIAGLSGSTEHERLRTLSADMVASIPEWMGVSCAKELNNGSHDFTFYFHPEVRRLADQTGALYYDITSPANTEIAGFQIGSGSPHTFYSLAELNTVSPKLVRFLYSRPFNELPPELQEHGGLRIQTANEKDCPGTLLVRGDASGPQYRPYVFRLISEGSYDAGVRGVRDSAPGGQP